MAKLKDFCTINPKAPVLADDLEVSFVPMTLPQLWSEMLTG